MNKKIQLEEYREHLFELARMHLHHEFNMGRIRLLDYYTSRAILLENEKEQNNG